MRKVMSIAAAAAGLVGIAAGAFILWRRNPRIGTGFLNSVVDPFLVRRGISGSGASEIGTLEHVGRKSGTRHLTPVYPEPTSDGFRVVVPLGSQSEWAHNVVAAGHCRLQLHDLVYDLDEPTMVPGGDIAELPRVVRRAMTALGFEYLKLRTFGSKPGSLAPLEGGEIAPDEHERVEAPAGPTGELVASAS